MMPFHQAILDFEKKNVHFLVNKELSPEVFG